LKDRLDNFTSFKTWIDVYKSPEFYEQVFGWEPDAEVEYIVALFNKYSTRVLKRTVEVGSGTGRVSSGLRSRGIEVVAVDLEYSMNSYAHRYRGLDALTADACRLPLRDNMFDLVFSMLSTLNHLKVNELKAFFEQAYSITGGGGMVVADMVINKVPCTGVCDEWKIEGTDCVASWGVMEVGEGYYLDFLEVRCGERVVTRTMSRMYLPRLAYLRNILKHVGFSEVYSLKSFTLNKPCNSGRCFVVAIKK